MDTTKENRCFQCNGFTSNGPGRKCSTCVEEDAQEEKDRLLAIRHKQLGIRLASIAHSLRRMSEFRPMPGENAKDELIGALLFACQKAVKELSDVVREAF